MDLRPCTDLYIVCCHAIFDNTKDDPFHESNWHLKPFQKSDRQTGKIGEHFTFIAHIQAAATALLLPNAFVVFSGGATDPSIPYSEAESYAQVFGHLYPGKQITGPALTHPRWSCETTSTDSYQNLLFSILEFRGQTGRYPDRVVVITHAFKADRFLNLHAPAIHWPQDRIRVAGINPPFTRSELDSVEQAERESAYALFQEDPYGIRAPLALKRAQRRWKPSNMQLIAADLEREVKSLVQWQGLGLYAGQLPWE